MAASKKNEPAGKSKAKAKSTVKTKAKTATKAGAKSKGAKPKATTKTKVKAAAKPKSKTKTNGKTKTKTSSKTNAKKRPSKKSAKKPKKAKSSSRLGGFMAGVRKALLRLLIAAGLFASLTAGVVLLWTDYQLRMKFDGKRWALPAKVYSRPLELYAGLDLSADDFEAELKVLSYEKRSKVLEAGQYSRRGAEFQVFSRGFQFWDATEPSIKMAIRIAQGQVQQIRQVAFPGQAMAESLDLALVRIEPLVMGGFYPSHQEDRVLIQLEQAPEYLLAALLAVEDRQFYEHNGVSLKGIARAMVTNIKAGRVAQGGSTLTQQLVKNFYLSSERSLTRKFKEAVMAILLELHYDKQEILETYLNEVYLGQSGRYGVHGFGLASEYYFGQSFEHLNLPQVALLVGLVKGASYYDPRSRPERALKRRNQVLQLLAEQGGISASQLAQAIRAPLGVIANPSYFHYRYPAYLDLVKRQLRQNYREEDIFSQGLKIFTSLNPRVQQIAERQLERSLAQLEGRYGQELNALEAAVVMTSPQNGEVIAMIGGREVRQAGFNRALDAVRPTGSLIKPAIYLTALERYSEYSLASLISDQPLQVPVEDGQFWSPQNFDHKSHGDVTLLQALVSSYNQAAARLGMTLGVEHVVETMQRLGLRRELATYPATLLGAEGLAPVEVAQIYQTLAARGFQQPIRAIREVMDAQGQSLSRYPFTVRQVIDPEAAYFINYGLSQVMRQGTGKSAYRYLSPTLNLAGKTGTTNDLRDSWFVGYSEDYLGVVWLGRDDNGETPLTGASGALRVWSNIFRELGPQSLDLTESGKVESLWFDPSVQKRSGALCEGAIQLPMHRDYVTEQWTTCGQGDRVINKIKSWFN